MIDTSRIQSGFDAELMIGKDWFLTAVQTLAANGVLPIPDGVTINSVAIINDPDWDLDLVTSIGVVVKATLSIVDGKFSFVTDFNNSTFEIDMPNLGNLADTPTLQKIMGDSAHENAMALLFNLNIRASEQNQDPLPNGEHLPRGNADDAVSFLPTGQHIALGLARDSFVRFGNNIWHTELRAPNGSHPIPRPGEDKKGDWHRVRISVTQRRIKFTLEGEAPIDFWPDADVTLELELKPKIVDGKLTFSIDTDLDIDTGFWGDLLAFTIGALVGLVIGIFTGGLLLVPSIGFGAVILLEIAEHVVGEHIERMIIATDENGNRIGGQVCDDQIVQLGAPRPSEDSFSIGVLDAIPTSIPVFTDEEDVLYDRVITVQSEFDDISLNGNGLAVAGKSAPSEILVAKKAAITESIYEGEELKQLKYELSNSNEEVTLDLGEVFDRLTEGELRAPIRVSEGLDDPIIQMPAGKLCCPCLTPTHIRRVDTVITRIRFDNGLELNTQDAIALQDRAGVYVEKLQLIHPSNANPYYRARANDSIEDNFESLPEF